MKRAFAILAASVLTASLPAEDYDLVIYGGTSAAIIAAVQAKKMGKSVIVVSPDKHLGGLSAGGLGFTDTGNKAVIGGLTPYFNDVAERTAYHFKRHVIQASIHGVDIDPGAVEIAKLRLWLSLVVDEDDVQQIKPLPNLDYKIVVGNSLLGFPFKSQRVQKIEKLKAEYFDETDHDKKRRLKREIDSELAQAFAASKSSLGYEVTFDFQIFFSEVFRSNNGFDVVVGNPPYSQLSKIAETPDWYKSYLRTRFNTSGGRLNTFIFFTHLACSLLKKGGNLAFIIPNTILTQEYYSATRELLLTKCVLKTVVQYSELPFENAVVENVTLIAINERQETYHIEIIQDNLSEKKLLARKAVSEFLNNPSFAISINSDLVTDKVFSLHKTTLEEFCEVNQAIALKGDRSLSLRTSNPDRKFFKVLDGRNIRKYSVHWDGTYLEYKLARIHSCKRQDIFLSKEKLFFRRVSERLMFAYDDKQHFALNTLVVVNLKSSSPIKLKCLLAILNSRLMDYLYKGKFKSTKTVFSEIQARTVRQLPIPKVDSATAVSLVSLVDRILAAKQRDVEADTNATEREIDDLVYVLYGLTLEEIQLVERTAK